MLPAKQELAILKCRNFVVNEGGPEIGAGGVVKGGPHAGASFVYVFDGFGRAPTPDEAPWR